MGEKEVEGQTNDLSVHVWGHVLIGNVESWQHITGQLRKEFKEIQHPVGHLCAKHKVPGLTVH